MGLNAKLYLSFFIMVALAVVTGFFGWTASKNISDSLNQAVTQTIPLNDKLNDLALNIENIRGSQRTLLSFSLSAERRAMNHASNKDHQRDIRRLADEVEALMAANGDAGLASAWQAARQSLAAWLAGGGKLEKMLAEWEETTILNPDQLISDLQKYRGDHYSLSIRLGQMVINSRNQGPDITSSDTACAFGQWRVAFDNHEAVFSENQTMVEGMKAMVEPHRLFHQTAHNLQAKLKEDPSGNRQLILLEFQKNVQYANEVIALFNLMVEEANRSRELFNQVQNFALIELNDLQNRALDDLNALIEANGEFTSRQSAATIQAGQRAVTIVFYLVVSALVLGLILALFMRRTIRSSLTRPLNRIIDGLSRDAEALAANAEAFTKSSQTLVAGAQEQESSLSTTSAALEEITSVSRKNADDISKADQLADENVGQVTDGVQAVERLNRAMDEINDSSERIGRILKTIEEIAFQTNLLALNAAVEAARAGEAGSGFAVVAEEVRNLAQRSAQAAGDTAQLITKTVDRIKVGSDISQEIHEKFSIIEKMTNNIGALVAEIKSSSDEQAKGMEQINSAVMEIDQVTQRNALVADDVFKACQGLGGQVESISEAIEGLGGVIGRRASR